MPGPVPKRSEQRRRRNKDVVEVERVEAQPGVLYGPELGLPDVHPLAAEWYESLRRSAQSVYFQPSDWAQAKVWTDLLSRELKKAAKPSAVMIAAWSSAAAELLTTEGARRRLRIEIERGPEVDKDEEAAVAKLDEYRRRLGASG